MQRYVSILRGINVSGQKKIKMEDLKTIFESLGLANVCTYIQSGNVVFDATTDKAEKIAKQIEHAIQKSYGFEVPVLLRTRAEMNKIIKANPFLEDKKLDTSKMHVTFLERPPGRSVLQNFKPGSLGEDRYSIRGADVFLYCPGGYGKTRLSNHFIEKHFGVRATTRNWKTVNVVTDMLKGNVASGK